jgi:hypothetical protein
MSTLTGTVGNLIQGVSQQDPHVRALGQVTEQINMRSNTALGLVRRPGTKFEFAIPADLTIDQDTAVYEYTSGDDKYIVFLRPDGMAVLDYEGNYQAISGGYDAYTAEFKDPALSAVHNLSDYVGSAESSESLMAHTVADTTFILNKEVTVGDTQTSAYVSSANTRSYIYVKKVEYGAAYVINENTGGSAITAASIVLPTSKTVAAGSVNLENLTSPSNVAFYLADALILAGYTAYVVGDSTIAVVGKDMSVDSDYPDNILVYKDKIARYEDLPPIGDDIQDVQIVGDTNAENKYYVKGTGAKYSKTSVPYQNPLVTTVSILVGTFTQYLFTDFRWDEVADDLQAEDLNGIDPYSMPHLLSKTASGFLVSIGDWENRPAGDGDTNPAPKFIGRTISDISDYQNRLVFLAGRYLCASRTDEWFAFWKDTVITVNPANPVNISAGTELFSSAKVAGDFIAFSTNGPYRVFGQSEPFTASSPLVKVADLQISKRANPKTTKLGVIAAYSSGVNTNLQELVVTGDSRLILPLPLTSHIPSYIEHDVVQIEMHNAYNMAFVRTKNGYAPSMELYVYEGGSDSSGKQVQQSWGKWVFGSLTYPDHIRHMWLNENTLYLILAHRDDATKCYVYSIPLDPAYTEYLTGFRPTVDRMQEVTTEALNPTEADINCGDTIVCILTDDDSGAQLAATSSGDRLYIDDPTIDVPTDVLVGRPMESSVTLSPLYLRHADGSPRITSRTQLKRMWLNYVATGHIEVEVTDKAGTVTTKVWDCSEDAINGIWDSLALQSGSLTVPLRGTNTDVTIKIKSSDYKPLSVTSLQFTARYGRRASTRAKNTVI